MIFRTECSSLNCDVSASRMLSDVLRDTVSRFEACGKDYVENLGRLVPMTRRRRKLVSSAAKFHDLDRTREDLVELFDIDLMKGLTPEEEALLRKMFLRRHLHEHRGSVADEVYLSRSGDHTIRVGQRVREIAPEVVETITLAERMINNLHLGFHEIEPPDSEALRLCSGTSKGCES